MLQIALAMGQKDSEEQCFMITNPHVLLHCSRKIADKRKRNQEVPALALGPARWNMPMDCINEMAPVTFKISFTELNKKPLNGIGAVFFFQICSILAANSGNQETRKFVALAIYIYKHIYIYTRQMPGFCPDSQ